MCPAVEGISVGDSPVVVRVVGVDGLSLAVRTSQSFEIEIGGVTQDYKCPISLRFLEDPLTYASQTL